MRKRIEDYPPHMRSALQIAVEETVFECRRESPDNFDPELHLQFIAALFSIEGTGEAFVRARKMSNRGGELS